jgi:predicted  nucleic acid-binding Zn-ribbon protein
MNEQVENLEALTHKQRELIKQQESEIQLLKTMIRTMKSRIQDLEKQHIVIDREIAEIPIGFDLIPEDDLNRH